MGSGRSTRLSLLVLEGLSDMWLRKEEVDRAEKRVQEGTGCDNLVEEKTGFVEAASQNYEVLIEHKWAGNAGPRTGTRPRVG